MRTYPPSTAAAHARCSSVTHQKPGPTWVAPLRRASALPLAVALISASHPTSAQEQPRARAAENGSPAATSAPGNSNDAEPSATVVVTGTSIQSADAAAYQSAPVSVVTADAIEKSGAASLQDYFQSQPDFVLSGQSSFSNTGGSAGANGTTLGATTLNLRGIGPQYTLVLLNGRRFQAEDPANIDLIPVNAIERVEVLKSGASAVYGSDAVAGVVNIITKRNADGFDFDSYFGASGQGDAVNKRFSASWGTSTDNLNFFAVAEYSGRQGLTQSQRSLSANPDLSRFNPNFNYQTFSYSSLAQTILPDGTGPLVLNQQTFTCGGYSRNPADYVPLNSHLYATGCDAQLNEGKRSLINPQRKGTFFASFDYKISDSFSVYSDFDFARSLVQSVGNLYGADGFGDVNSPLDLSPIPANYYWNPFGQPITSVTYGFPEAGPQVDDVDNTAWRINLGVKGSVGPVHYDAGGSYYYNYANAFDYNMPTNSGLYAAENRPGPLAINLFCNACNTAAQIAGVFSGTSRQDWEEAALLNAHAYAPVYALPAGDINLAAGVEYQRDTYIVQPSQQILDNFFSDDTETAISAGRRYEAVYVEGQLPVFGNNFAFPGAASLGLDVAARYENIQAVGSRTDPTISIRWEPIANSVAVRGSYGTSFRAPSLSAIDAPVSSAGGSALINPANGQFQDYTVVTGGNPNLKPETATYINYGIVLTPRFAPGLTVQLDRWLIDQKNIVIQTSPQFVLDGIQPGSTFTAANGVPGINSLYMNAAEQQVNGTDLDIDYRFRTDSAGLFDFRWSGTYLNSFKVNEDTGSGLVQYAGGTALATSLSQIAGLPKVRFLLAANWVCRALSATYLLHYTGSYEDPTIPGGVEVNRYISHDIQLNLDFAKLLATDSWLSQLKLSVGANDLTNATVPIFYAGALGGGLQANGYDTSIVNPTGRFFYASVHLSIPRH
jgi:iron complex outermembrane recepter protein